MKWSNPDTIDDRNIINCTSSSFIANPSSIIATWGCLFTCNSTTRCIIGCFNTSNFDIYFFSFSFFSIFFFPALKEAFLLLPGTSPSSSLSLISLFSKWGIFCCLFIEIVSSQNRCANPIFQTNKQQHSINSSKTRQLQTNRNNLKKHHILLSQKPSIQKYHCCKNPKSFSIN